MEGNQVEGNQVKRNQVEGNQVEGNQVERNQVEGNQMEMETHANFMCLCVTCVQPQIVYEFFYGQEQSAPN